MYIHLPTQFIHFSVYRLSCPHDFHNLVFILLKNPLLLSVARTCDLNVIKKVGCHSCFEMLHYVRLHFVTDLIQSLALTGFEEESFHKPQTCKKRKTVNGLSNLEADPVPPSFQMRTQVDTLFAGLHTQTWAPQKLRVNKLCGFFFKDSLVLVFLGFFSSRLLCENSIYAYSIFWASSPLYYTSLTPLPLSSL